MWQESADFQFLAWALGTGDGPTESRVWEGNWFGDEDDNLYCGHDELELSVGPEGKEVCSLRRVTQSLWVLVFSFVK